jgi:hypothetical protein
MFLITPTIANAAPPPMPPPGSCVRMLAISRPPAAARDVAACYTKDHLNNQLFHLIVPSIQAHCF